MEIQNPSRDNLLPLKIEVKAEAVDPSPLTLPPTSRFINDAFAFAQSTFKQVLLECLQGRFFFPPKPEPQLTRFPVFIHDPFTLNAFAHFKAVGELIKDNNNRKALVPQKPKPMKKKEKKLPKAVAPKEPKEPKEVKEKEPLPVVKEENLDQTNPKNVEEQKTEQPPKKVPKKKAQNRIKNIPGLIMQRVRSSIKAYLTRNPKYEKQERRLTYVDKILGSLSKQEKDKILAFLESYQKNWKTWNTIQKYLQTNPKCGAVLLDTVLEFFGQDGLEDFNDWLTSGKMGEKSKAAVTDMKDRIGQKFSKILLKSDEEEEEEELCLRDKMIKNEERLVKKEECM